MTNVHTFREMKEQGRKIVFLTAYDWMLARYVAAAGVDGILVGDSVGQVFAGHSTTIPVTVDEMIYHARAVRRGAPDTFLVVDMPFLSFQISPEEALRNAGRILKETGAEAVKLEGGRRIAETVRRLVETGIPVMGHLGLTPQSVHAFGGYGLRAADEREAAELVEDARSLSDAGSFAIVLEKIPRGLAARVTVNIPAPTIGIGAGAGTDGQVLVTYDLLGLTPDFRPKFVRRYGELGGALEDALGRFVDDVRGGGFPGEAESWP
ncbi:MAG: 3-methyl-2-oxobutanoate hydroxymethyltransferase [Gemmatimonadota bacterium]